MNAHIAATRGRDGGITLAMKVAVDHGPAETRVAAEPVTGMELYLRTDLDFVRNKGTCAYGTDGTHWKTLGGEFDLAFDWRTGTFQGEQFAIFCFNPNSSDGLVDVDWFRLTDQKPLP